MGGLSPRRALGLTLLAVALAASSAVAEPLLPEPVVISCPLGALPVTPSAPGALKGTAGARLQVGAAAAAGPLRDEQAYRDALAREYAVLTPENAMKMEVVQGVEGVFNFCDANLLASFAEANDMTVRGTPLVWHLRVPDWATAPERSRDEMIDVLRRHVTAVVSHFRGRVTEWDVVNEPIEADGSLRRSVWLDRIGPDYIDIALRAAHEADPDARLFLNDYGFEEGGPRADAYVALARRLLASGVPLHGIGMQAHLTADYPPAVGRVMATMNRFADLGLEVAVTELDVAAAPPTRARFGEGPGGWRDRQAAIYRAVVEACLRVRRCDTVVTWGVSDGHTWKPGEMPLLLDESYAPKPAYAAVAETLRRG